MINNKDQESYLFPDEGKTEIRDLLGRDSDKQLPEKLLSLVEKRTNFIQTSTKLRRFLDRERIMNK